MLSKASPAAIESPSRTSMLVIWPSLEAVILVSIFIASSTNTVSPALTCWPTVTGILITLPASGALMGSPPDATGAVGAAAAESPPIGAIPEISPPSETVTV